MTWYLATAPRSRELEAAWDLRSDGYEAWCGLTVTYKRKPHGRWENTAVWPGYLFLSLSDADFHRLAHGEDQYRHTGVSRRFLALSDPARRDFERHKEIVESAYDEAWRAIQAGERLAEYQIGQALRITAGPFMREALVTFAGETPDGKARLQTEMMGRKVTVDIPAENVEAV